MKVTRLSQGLQCKTPFANSLQSSNASSVNPSKPKPVNCSYSQNASFDTMKTRHRFSPLGGCKEEFIFDSRYWINRNASNPALDSEVQFQGCWDANEVGAEGTKIMSGKVPPTHPNHRTCHILFWTKRGVPSVIGFSNYFPRGEFRHVRTQQ